MESNPDSGPAVSNSPSGSLTSEELTAIEDEEVLNKMVNKYLSCNCHLREIWTKSHHFISCKKGFKSRKGIHRLPLCKVLHFLDLKVLTHLAKY